MFLLFPFLVTAESSDQSNSNKNRPETKRTDIGILYDRSKNRQNSITTYRGQARGFVNFIKMDLNPVLISSKKNKNKDQESEDGLKTIEDDELYFWQDHKDPECKKFALRDEFLSTKNELDKAYNELKLNVDLSAMFEFDGQVANDNRTTGIDSDNDYSMKLAYGFYKTSNDTDHNYYNPDDLNKHNVGLVFNGEYSDLLNEDLNLELFYQYRKKYFDYVSVKQDDICKLNELVKTDMHLGISGRYSHNRDFSDGSTFKFDWSYRWGDFNNREYYIGPRIVVGHFIPDQSRFKNETTVSLQLNGDFKLGYKIKNFELRFQPTIGYEKIYNHLGEDDDTSSLFGLLAIVARLAPESLIIAGGRRGGGRYYRP